MTTAHLLPDKKEKKSADDSACAFWTRDARYQECVMRPAIVQRNATESNEKENCFEENAIRLLRFVRAVICKEAIRRTRSSLLKLVRRI